MNFQVSPKKIYHILLFFSIGLAIAGLFGLIFNLFSGDFFLKTSLIRLTDLKEEVSIGTWYASSVLLLASLLLLIIALIEQKADGLHVNHWKILSIIFLFLSLDEAASIHEIGDSLHDTLGIYTKTTFLWTLPYTILLIIFIISYYKFLINLPKKTRNLFVVSGGIFIAGALGLELVAAGLQQLDLANIVPITVLIEEFFEMLGITVFIYALVLYIESRAKDIHVLFENAEKS